MEEQKITELKEALNKAIRQKDVEKTTAVFADHTVMFVLAPPLQFVTGENAPGANGVAEWFATFDVAINLNYVDFKIYANGDLAFTHCIEHMSGKRADGSHTDIWYRETLGLQKIAGEWKIVHQHQSVPFYMDGSDKAATDLKP